MAPNSANMSQHARSPEYDRAAFLAAQVNALLTGEPNPASSPAPAPLAKKSPAKKRKSIPAARAKAALRASKIPRRKIESARESSFEYHRRRCRVCHHPEREAIEELFINWHAPRDIKRELGIYPPLDWSSIYRHARAAGLFEKRRRNLRAVFDLVLESASDIAPTAHGIVAIVRAYTCLTATQQWIEPEKRVHITNHIYHHDLPACPDKGRAAAGLPAVAGLPSSSSLPVGQDTPSRQESAFTGAPSFAPSAKGGFSSENSTPPVPVGAQTSSAPAPSVSQPAPISTTATSSPQNPSAVSFSSPPASANISAPNAPPATPTSYLASTSNRHNPAIRIASNSHKTNGRRISNRHISPPVSSGLTRPEKEPR
jgi:hypothetical protein